MAAKNEVVKILDNQEPENMAIQKAVYFRGEKIPIEEDLTHEFKGHRTITIEEVKPHQKKMQTRTRQQWSKYLCGLLNTGLGGTLYGGILDDGTVSGFSMSKYQKLHVILAISDLFKRFNPPVPHNMWSLKFVPVAERGEDFYQKDPTRIRDELWKMDHRLRDHRYCWCDTEALTSFSFGFINPFFVVEVSILPWDSEACRGPWGNQQPAFSAEDGQFYVRKHGVTEMYSRDEMMTWREEQRRVRRRRERFGPTRTNNPEI